jgi:hypothetical protein
LWFCIPFVDLRYWNIGILISISNLKCSADKKNPYIGDTEASVTDSSKRFISVSYSFCYYYFFHIQKGLDLKGVSAPSHDDDFNKLLRFMSKVYLFFYYFLKWNCRSKIDTRQTSQLFMLVDYKTVINLMLLRRFNNL